MSFHNGGNIVTSGLVLALDASSPRSYPGSGTTWYDLSGNNYHATDQASTQYITSSYPNYFDFNGADYFSIPENSDFDVMQTNFTCEVWLKTKNIGEAQQGIFSIRNNFTDGWTVYIRQGPEFSFIGYDESNATSGTKTMYNGLINVNQWYHVVYTYNGSHIRGYVDGTQYVFSAYTGIFDSSVSQPARIGLDTNIGDPNYLSGSIGYIGLYNRALSATEVLQNYNALKGRFF